MKPKRGHQPYSPARQLTKPTSSLTVAEILRLESLSAAPTRLNAAAYSDHTNQKSPLKTITTWRSVLEAEYVEIGYNANQRSTTFVSPN